MAKPFDAVLKQLLDAFAAGRVVPLDPGLSTVQPTADKVFRLDPPAAGLPHLEVQSPPSVTAEPAFLSHGKRK